ncbi:hypothetical protein ACVWYJ_004563 [Bradyrhizobium sp. USDA 4471]
MHERYIEAIDAEPLEAILDRATHAVGGVVEYDVIGRIRERINLGMPVVLRGLEQLPNFRRKQIFISLLGVEKPSEPPLGQPEAVPWRNVEVAHPDLPGRFERAFGVLVGVLVELVAERNPAEPEAKAGLKNLLRAIGHVWIDLSPLAIT